MDAARVDRHRVRLLRRRGFRSQGDALVVEGESVFRRLEPDWRARRQQVADITDQVHELAEALAALDAAGVQRPVDWHPLLVEWEQATPHTWSLVRADDEAQPPQRLGDVDALLAAPRPGPAAGLPADA